MYTAVTQHYKFYINSSQLDSNTFLLLLQWDESKSLWNVAPNNRITLTPKRYMKDGLEVKINKYTCRSATLPTSNPTN